MKIVDAFIKSIAIVDLETLTESKIEELKNFTFTRDFKENRWRNFYTDDGKLLDQPIFKEVRDEIVKYCYEYSALYGHIIEGLDIVNSWAFSTNDGDPIFHHMHPNGYISGVFYLTGGAPIHFVDHSMNYMFHFYPIADVNKMDIHRGSARYSVDPEPGKLILFPAGMYHEVTPYKEGNTRLSIAFNALPYGKLGLPPSTINLAKWK